MTSKEYLSKSHQEYIIRKISESFKIIECDHNFYAYGLGYKCDCGVYTGTNSELNSIIKKEIEERGLELRTTPSLTATTVPVSAQTAPDGSAS